MRGGGRRGSRTVGICCCVLSSVAQGEIRAGRRGGTRPISTSWRPRLLPMKHASHGSDRSLRQPTLLPEHRRNCAFYGRSCLGLCLGVVPWGGTHETVRFGRTHRL